MTNELRAEVSATLDGVEEFCQRFRQWHEQSCGGRDRFATELLLREALGNSVAHAGPGGGPAGPETVLGCVVRGSGRRLLIAVRDNGAGFDWQRQRLRPRAEKETSGRGVSIYYRYAHRVRFLAPGNGVVLVRFWGAHPRERAR